MNKLDCRGYRRTDDIDPQWLADYAHKNPGVYLFGAAENIDQLKKDLGSIEWNVVVIITDDQRWDCFSGMGQPLLGMNTPNMDRIAREIEAMRQVYSRVYGHHSGGRAFDPDIKPEKSTDHIKE